MKHRHYTIVCLLIAISVTLSGCETQNSLYEEKLKRDKFIQKEFAPPEKQPQQKLIKTYYYNEIQAGQVVVGMSLLETLMATKTYPHGSNKHNMVQWCDGAPVSQCKSECGICAAILFAEKQTHFLRGKGQEMFVEKSIPRQVQDTVINFRDKPYPVVNALFQNRIVEGMDVRDFERIELLPNTRQKFYCNNQQVFKNCLHDCGDCTVQLITQRNDRYHIQTIKFRGRFDFKTIIEVSESTQASIQ